MSRLFKHVRLNRKIKKIYWDRFRAYGPSPRGSFWLTKTRQNRRFKLILDAVQNLSPRLDFSLADVGCGYGAMAEYLAQNHIFKSVQYTGYDISPELIEICQKKFCTKPFYFKVGTYPSRPTMFTVMSGTYNLAVTPDLKVWERYVMDSILTCWNQSTIAVIFNLQIAEVARISRDHIYYANIHDIQKKCSDLFGPTTVSYHPDVPQDMTFCVSKTKKSPILNS